jgi:hypothetical protein
MKLKLLIFFLLYLFTASAQNSINIVVFPSLSNIDFTSLFPSNELQNNVRVFCVEVSPQGVPVVIKGVFEWQKVGSNSFVELGNFTTNPFTSRNFCNEELGDFEISLKSFNSNKDLLDENLRIGVPSGIYKITLMLYDASGHNLLAQDSEELYFLNPSQTFQVINPKAGLSYDAGNVIIEWTPIAAAESYSIKVNTRKNPNQSLEEALNSGTPLVNNRNVGQATSVNLREILERELEYGSEVVLQVSANLSGPYGGNKLLSPIVNFYTFKVDNSSSQIQIIRLRNLLSRLPNSQLLSLIENNQIDFSSIVFRTDDGRQMSLDELLNFLEANFENVLRIESE